MSAPAAIAAGGPALKIRGRAYPVLLPRVRDPRLHLAAVIVSLLPLTTQGQSLWQNAWSTFKAG